MKKKFYLLPILVSLLLITCKKNTDSLDPNDINTEKLKTEDVTFIDNLLQTSYTVSDAKLPNGRTVYDFLMEKDPTFLQNLGNAKKSVLNTTTLGTQDKKNLIIARMQAMAFYLTDRTKHTYPNEGSNKPAQIGLAYSFGSRDYKIRQIPPLGSCREVQLYGLDCSGFMYNLVISAGLQFSSSNAETQRKVGTWENAFKANPEYTKLKMQDFGQLSISELESGDIIYWTEGGVAKHIGVVLNTGSGLAVFQSNGAASETCEKNYTIKRGPNQIKLQNLSWFGSTYGIVRIVADISGEYTAYIRCTGQTTDAMTIKLTVPTNTGGTFRATGTGTDYNGDPISAVFDGSYDKKTNILNGIFSFIFPPSTAITRKDSFQKRLDFDDTGYFSMTKVLDNGGCAADMRLVNNETNPIKKSIKTEINNECSFSGMHNHK